MPQNCDFSEIATQNWKSKTIKLFEIIKETSKATVNDARYKVKVKVIKVKVKVIKANIH